MVGAVVLAEEGVAGNRREAGRKGEVGLEIPHYTVLVCIVYICGDWQRRQGLRQQELFC